MFLIIDLEKFKIMICFLKFIFVVDKDFLIGCGELYFSVGVVGRFFFVGFKNL